MIRGKKIVTFENFEQGHSTTAADLRSLKQQDFIVLTTAEGGIAVDY